MILRQRRSARQALRNSAAKIEALENRTLLSAAYVITDLGFLPSATGARATAINAAGTVVGEQDFGQDASHASLWNSTRGAVDLGTLPNDSQAVANAINAAGDVVGTSGNAFTIDKATTHRDISDGHAFLWTAAGGMQDLGILAGYTSSEALGINSAGVVVGDCKANGVEQAFVWTAGGGMQALAGGTASEADAINDAGQIAGTAAQVPVIWQTSASTPQTLVNTGFGQAFAINSAGHLAGNNQAPAALWTDPSTTVSLGLLPSSTGNVEIASAGLGVNDSDQIVGNGYTGGGEDAGTFPGGSFVYSAAAGLQDLNTLVNPNPHPGFYISSASGINNNGLIAASGYNAEQTDFAYLLTPIASAPAVQLVFTQQPLNGAAGASLAPIVVTLEDQNGNILTGDTSGVTLSVVSPTTGMLAGTLTEPVQNGIATFSTISVAASGNYTLGASDGADGSAISSVFTATAPPTGTAAASISLSSTNIDPNSPTTLLTVTATVSPITSGGATPTGVVAFYDNGVPIVAPVLDASGTATLATSFDLPLPLGTDSITAAYSGDGAYGPATSSPLVETVSNAATVGPGLSGKLLPSAIAGQKINLTQTLAIADFSSVPYSGLETVHFYLSPTTMIGSSAIELPQSVQKAVHLLSHRSTKVKLSIKSIPVSVPAGTYYLISRGTDAFGNTDAEDAGGQITVAAAQLDLSGSFVKLSTTFKAGKKATIALAVANAGNVAATGELSVELDASPDGLLDGTATPIPTTPVKINIKPGKSAVIHLSRLSLPSGTFTLIATLDPQNTFGDVNLANNTIFSATTITVG